MGPTSKVVIYSVIVLTVLATIVSVWLLARRKASVTSRPVRRALLPLGLLALCQVLAISSVFLVVNEHYGFYDTWQDILGVQQNAPETVHSNGLDPGTGKLVTLEIDGKVSHVKGEAMVWLPPQYSDAGHAATKFPVVMMLPGQPSSPEIVYNEYHFGIVASQEISSGAVKPFVAVFPPIMINPPRDTECVNVPNGPQAESWLTKDVPAALEASYRVQPMGKQWSVMGWSTGGLCAAKLSLKYPKWYGAGVSFGGVMEPYEDDTTGNLWQGDINLRKANDPMYLYESYLGTRGGKLMLVVGRQDKESWTGCKALINVATGDPNVSVIAFPKGGHNDQNYAVYMPTVLRWLQQSGTLG